MYSEIEAQLKSILLLQTTVFANTSQVRRGDWGNLDAGFDTTAVLYPGAFEEVGYGGANTVERIWTVHLDLLRRIGGNYADAVASFITDRDAVLVHLQKYPKLNGLQIGGEPAVIAVVSIVGDEPAAISATDDSGPFAIKQTFDLRIREDYTVATVD